jgi:serine/threonine-protein kinase
VLAATAAAEAAAAPAPATQLLAPLGSTTQVLPPGSPWPPTGPTGRTTPVPPPTRDDPPKRRGLLWTLIVVALLAVGAIVALAIINGQREQAADLVTVPSLEGMTEQAALQELQTVNLTMERLEEASDDVDEGLVVRSNPDGGEEVEAGSSVEVVISAGPDAVAIPEVAGMTQEQATTELREAGLDVSSVEFENAPRVPRNEVTKTEPAAGESVPRDTEVVLYVASGQVDLPDLVTKPRAEALQILEDLGLSSTITEEETSDAPPDTVVAQDRSAGQVPQTTSVGLTIAVAPTTVAIPDDLVGQTYEEAAAQLTGLGLTPVRADVDSDEPVGQVISTNPNRGTTVQIGSEVTLNVSRGSGADNEGAGDGEGEGDQNAEAPTGTGSGADPVAGERSARRTVGTASGTANGVGNGNGNSNANGRVER